MQLRYANRRFLDISLGSLSELSYPLRVARDLGFLADEDWQTLDMLRDHAGKLTWGCIAQSRTRATRSDRKHLDTALPPYRQQKTHPLGAFFVMGQGGVEPPTSRLSGVRS
ncbi:MAG: four helix bundle protein, partial [Gemmatimonadetes bacterium]|nr:four helix bundle protein [Gemmatimonadota bacterium]